MKRILIAILAILLIASCGALAEKVAVPDGEGGIWFFADGMISRLTADDEFIPLCAANVTAMGCADGELYFVNAETDEYGDVTSEEVLCLDQSGNVRSIAPVRELRRDMDFTDDYSFAASATEYVGYQDFAVADGKIFFIGNNGRPGTYTTTIVEDEGTEPVTRETRFESGLSLYSMSLDGKTLTELVPDLGNGRGAHFALGGGRIAVSSCLLNPCYAYDFTNFMLCDPDGSVRKVFQNTRGYDMEAWVRNENCAYTVIVNSLQTDGKQVWASLGDSEGDFASSTLVELDSVGFPLGYEAWYIRSIVTPEGVYRMASDWDDVFYDESMETTTRLSFFDEDEKEHMLLYIPLDYIYDSGFDYTLIGDTVYAAAGINLVRVRPGELPEVLVDGAWEYAYDFDPEHYGEGETERGA